MEAQARTQHAHTKRKNLTIFHSRALCTVHGVSVETNQNIKSDKKRIDSQ
jgi:hypothetical protein